MGMGRQIQQEMRRERNEGYERRRDNNSDDGARKNMIKSKHKHSVA